MPNVDYTKLETMVLEMLDDAFEGGYDHLLRELGATDETSRKQMDEVMGKLEFALHAAVRIFCFDGMRIEELRAATERDKQPYGLMNAAEEGDI